MGGPAQGFLSTVRPSHSSLCRGPARDTQHRVATFHLDSEASIRLTAEQANFFLVKPLESLPRGMCIQNILRMYERGQRLWVPGAPVVWFVPASCCLSRMGPMQTWTCSWPLS